MVSEIIRKHQISERRACRLLGQNRSTQRYVPRRLQDEDEVTGKIVEVVSQYGYYGYRLVTGMLRGMGYRINHKRVYRIWRSLGLKIPERQPKRRRLWLDENSCIRFRAEHRNHVWSYDFVAAKTSRGRKIKILNIIDEHTRECLCSHPATRIRSEHVIEQLREVMLEHGTPEYIRSNNGSEFIVRIVRDWLESLEIAPLYITPGSPWENGYVESFNGSMAYELLNCEIFDTLKEAKILIATWVREYNTIRPHSALGYRPPAPIVYIASG